MKTFASKEDKKEYYKARQQKENARNAKREAEFAKLNTYDVAANVAGIAAEVLATPIRWEWRHTGGSCESNRELHEFLDCQGRVNQDFWLLWKNEDDCYSLNRGAMSFRTQMLEQGIAVTKLADGRWTLVVKGVTVLNNL